MVLEHACALRKEKNEVEILLSINLEVGKRKGMISISLVIRL